MGRAGLIVPLLFLAGQGHAQMTCGDGTGTVSQQEYVCADAERVDAETALIDTMRGFLASLDLQDASEAAAAFEAAQHVWMQSAEQTCTAESLLYLNGTLAPTISARCMTAMLIARTAYFADLSKRPRG